MLNLLCLCKLNLFDFCLKENFLDLFSTGAEIIAKILFLDYKQFKFKDGNLIKFSVTLLLLGEEKSNFNVSFFSCLATIAMLFADFIHYMLQYSIFM